ncbi:MAG: GNAT family N-acetyltransferase [Candidatus Paceibacterota bacterium]
MRLVTKRLILRPIEKKDAKDLVENLNNIKVSRYLLRVSHPYRLKDAKSWIGYCSKESKEKPQKVYDFAIELKSEKKQIGGIEIGNVDRFQGKAEVGYWLGEKHWGQGIASEALSAIIDFAFNKLNLRRLEAGVFMENKASSRLLEKFGFKKEGSRIECYRSKATGKIHGDYFYGLLKKNYKAGK